ncbi:unnamed protein product, partial [Iphiclides podalirius]
MVPKPQEKAYAEMEGDNKSGERVVISGMSGLFPDSRHVQDLADILYNKKNPISSKPRWRYNHPEVSQHTGKVPNLEYFDAQFFKVHYRLGHTMDAMSRKILEQAYQAIYDSGVSPEHLSGKKVGVYIGTCFSESEKVSFYGASTRTGFGVAGCNKSMFANRISYWLNAKGPSMSIDESCCSSIAALEQAYLALSRGDCEAAIVGGGNVCLHPQSSVHYSRIMSISMDGKTRSFDENASGCAKSEAINVLFLQKAKDALRIYADVILVKSQFTHLHEDKTGPKFGFYRDPARTAEFLNNFYQEAKVPPQAVEYVEAFGSAIPEADKAELESLDSVFCKNRNNELLVGSVMSNIGYGEAASGISAVTKVLLGYHKGALAANLNLENPRRDVAALRDGRIRILTENEPFGRTYAAVNALTITGVNAHVLLHGHYKPKDNSRYKSDIPYLVAISARQNFSVQNVLDNLKSRPIDPEEVALLHNIHSTRISGHLGRGFIILGTNEQQQTVSLSERAEYFDNLKRPLWFVYSGMGSQWVGMGTHLMRIPIFAAAIERCHRVLEPKGVDIVDIITSTDKSTFDNILNSFVGIAAIQIGLTDVLRELGLEPDNIIGHSVGELGCAYADGCFTAEEMILAAYYRGLVSVQTPFVRGSMAAVGIGYQQVIKMCPPEIVVACHNGPESSTISGPAEIMKTFVAELTAKRIFAKEVPCSNIAYHSRYIAEAGPELLKHLSKVIKTPKLRSKRWLSTSVPQDRWNEPIAKYSSAEYHTNNLLSAVLFEETSRLIPANAVLVEVAPHGLLQAILKRSLPESCRHVPLTRRGHPDNVQYFLEAIGKLYMEGYNLKVQVLYPKIEFPVSTGTPFLSHLVEWAHSEKWSLPLYVSAHRKIAASCKFVYSIHDVENEYLTGHVINGKNTFPLAAALVAAWDVLAMTVGVPKKSLSVEFHDVKFYCQPVLHDLRLLRLFVSLHRGTGLFEIMDENTKVAIGRINGEVVDTKAFAMESTLPEELELNSQDTYQLLSKRGYSYSGEFRSIHSISKCITEAQIFWRNNWVTFIDGMLQLSALRHPHDTVSDPIYTKRMIIDVIKHNEVETIPIDENIVMKANVIKTNNLIRCGGVAIEDVKFRDLPTFNKKKDLMSLHFIPFFQQSDSDIATALFVYLQIVAENVNKTTINILQLSDNEDEVSNFKDVVESFTKIANIKVHHDVLCRNILLEKKVQLSANFDLLLVENLSADDKLCQTLHHMLCNNTFLINKENCSKDSTLNRPSTLYHVLSAQYIKGHSIELVHWRPTTASAATTAFTVRSSSDLDLLSSTLTTLPQQHRLLIITSHPTIDRLKALVQKWRKDRLIHVVVMNHQIDEDRNAEGLPNNDLAFNVLNNGQWGGWFFVPFRQKPPKVSDMSLQCSRVGDCNSLHWVEIPKIVGPGIKVTVHYAGINDIDVKRCNGIIPPDAGQNSFGMDFSGVTERGERVMGLVSSGAASSHVLASPELLWPVPKHWTLEEAATVPLAYCVAFYCLCIKYRLYPGMSILVHGGAGAIGQAVISIALRNGCRVFTTVSDVSKKRFLRKMFSELKDDDIGNSRDHTFGDLILTTTNGNGCDIVISCVKDNLTNASMKCVKLSGITLDLVQIATRDNYSFGMYNLNKDRCYTTIDFLRLLTQGNVNEIRQLQLMMSEGIKRGYVRPLSRVVYSPLDAPRAFRLLAASRHRGRALLQLRSDNQDRPVPQPEPRLHLESNLSHLILCNQDYFGFRIAERLVKRGAKKIYLHGLKQSALLEFEVRTLEKLGVQVKICNEALNCKNDVKTLINDCARLGKVKGVYIVSKDDQSLYGLNVLQELDSVTRKNCPNLKYFCLVNGNSNNGLQTCITRAQDKLPVTLLKLPTINTVDSGKIEKCEKTIFKEYTIDSFEYALTTNEPVLLAYEHSEKSRSLLEDIAMVAGIKIPHEINETVSLSELQIGSDESQIIYSYLRNYYNICLSEKDIPDLTIQRIREMHENMTDTGFSNTKGLATFYSYVDPDELLVTTEMVFLPTIVSNSTMRDDEFDVTQTYLCLIPGLEGHYERFRNLCERLKVPAIVLQPGLERPDETVSSLAQRYAEILLKKAELKRKFYLMGYESGTLVALEMAAILEDQGITGTVFCVGESPDKFRLTLDKELGEYENDEELQIATALHMCNLMVGGETDGLEDEIRNATSWPEKVKTCVQSILGRVSHSAQYARETIECAYGRIKQLQAYRPTPRALRSKIILIQAASSDGSSQNSMQSYSQQAVIVYQLRAPLAHAAADLRCTAIINKHLDAELLEAFERKNLCDTYLFNADTFVSMDPAYTSLND